MGTPVSSTERIYGGSQEHVYEFQPRATGDTNNREQKCPYCRNQIDKHQRLKKTKWKAQCRWVCVKAGQPKGSFRTMLRKRRTMPQNTREKGKSMSHSQTGARSKPGKVRTDPWISTNRAQTKVKRSRLQVSRSGGTRARGSGSTVTRRGGVEAVSGKKKKSGKNVRDLPNDPRKGRQTLNQGG